MQAFIIGIPCSINAAAAKCGTKYANRVLHIVVVKPRVGAITLETKRKLTGAVAFQQVLEQVVGAKAVQRIARLVFLSNIDPK